MRDDDVHRNKSQQRRRTRLRRAGSLAVALAGAAVLAAACGGSPATATGGSSVYQKALPFAQCMRSHGIQNFPDPDSSGGFNIGDSVKTKTPQYAAAKSTCVRLHPYNMVLSPQQKAGLMSRALKFARCMRAHGEPNFPDPVQNNGGLSFYISGGPAHNGSSPSAGSGNGGTGASHPSTSLGSGGPSESPQYQAAAQACQKYEGKGKL